MSKTFAQLALENDTPKDNNKGVYCALELNTISKDAITDTVKQLDIPEAITSDEYHVTIAYSKKHFDPGYTSRKEDIIGTITDFTYFPNSAKPGYKALVLLLDCDEAVQLHDDTMDRGASYDYPEYKPHITLSYDIADDYDFDFEKFRDMKVYFNRIYSEPLDIEWSDNMEKMED